MSFDLVKSASASKAVRIVVVVLCIAWPPLCVGLGLFFAVRRFVGKKKEAKLNASCLHLQSVYYRQFLDKFEMCLNAGMSVRIAINTALEMTSADGADVSKFESLRSRISTGESTEQLCVQLEELFGIHSHQCFVEVRRSLGDGVGLLRAIGIERAKFDANLIVRREEAAKKAPVKMLMPLVLCSLPAFILVSVVPLIISTISELKVF